MSRWDMFVWLITPAAVVAATAFTLVCLLKGKKIWSAIGLAATGSAVWLMVWSWSASSEAFEDLGIVVLFQFWAVPLILITMVGALRAARSGSWWDRRFPPTAPSTTA